MSTTQGTNDEGRAHDPGCLKYINSSFECTCSKAQSSAEVTESTIDYAARLDVLLSKVNGESIAVENGWEVPREPARYLAVELSDSE